MAEEENPFDKVMLTARIAGLEVTNKHLTDTLAVREKAVADMSAHLKQQSAAFSRAAQMKKERVAEAFSQLSAWLPEKDAAVWRGYVMRADVVQGLTSIVTALILETLHGSRPKEQE